ncbi:MAG TPA: SIS domain-containing protein [Kouleothrix sp.]|uniref:SIS domain-containing protein n=1 Tax=Kouleothrix sp. TaxID=2779161 RepID=UPI002C703028|nr:SIS domain-containing protein [Kouleothrix sp.]
MTTFLEQEIRSQPEVIARLLEREGQNVRQIAAQLPPFDHVLIAARGTSDHAAIYAKYAWASLAGYPVGLATPALYTLYHTPPHLANTLVVGISQSGQSPDIVAVLEEGKRQGRPTLAITNDGASPLAATADHVIELHAGVERSVAATKTYTAQLTAMAMLAAALGGQPERNAELAGLPAALDATLAATTSVPALAARFQPNEQYVLIGRGFNFATALELSLKLKELTYVMTVAYSSADFRHGPIATVSEGTPVLVVMPRGAAFADLSELAHDLHERGADLVAISDADAIDGAGTLLPVAANLPEWLSPIAAIVPGQMLALHLALARGGDPDRPRGLRKITLTR